MGGRVSLSELVMFFALLGGLQAFGVLGIVLGPVLFAIAASILNVFERRSGHVRRCQSQHTVGRSTLLIREVDLDRWCHRARLATTRGSPDRLRDDNNGQPEDQNRERRKPGPPIAVVGYFERRHPESAR